MAVPETHVYCCCCCCCSERYDALVTQLMVVVVKASVAAEQLEKALLAANRTPGMRCNCKPGEALLRLISYNLPRLLS
jgi:hypothetical protein